MQDANASVLIVIGAATLPRLRLLSPQNFDTIVAKPTLATVRMTVPQAIVLERNKLVVRRIARVLGCAGFEVATFEEPDKVDASALRRRAW